jgi:hypothetical protein
MRPGFGKAAFMISRVRRSARLFADFVFTHGSSFGQLADVVRQDWLHAYARRDDVAGSRLNIEGAFRARK